MFMTVLRNALGWMFTLFMSGLACAMGILLWGVGLRLGWLALCKPWAVGSLRIVKVNIEITGEEHLAGPAIFASNHQAMIDVVFLPALLPKTLKWVAKRELIRIPLWGWAFSAGAVFIDRSDPHKAWQDIEAGLQGLPRGWSICIFPEGTRSRTGELGAFKKGLGHIALRTRLPVVPMAFDGAHDVTPPGGGLVYPGTIQLTVGAPIPTDHWREENLAEHLAEVRDAVQMCLDSSRRRRLRSPSSEPDFGHSRPEPALPTATGASKPWAEH